MPAKSGEASSASISVFLGSLFERSRRTSRRAIKAATWGDAFDKGIETDAVGLRGLRVGGRSNSRFAYPAGPPDPPRERDSSGREVI